MRQIGRMVRVGAVLLALLVIPLRMCGGPAPEPPVRPATVRPPVATPERPRPWPTRPALTRVPAPRPWPTPSPLEAQSRAPAFAPVAPTLWAAPTSTLTNTVYDGMWFSADMALGWSHEDPPGVEYYVIWHSSSEPYLDPGCMSCTMITTTALSEVVAAPGQTFVPHFEFPESDIMSQFDFYLVQAVNAAGVSDGSNRVGVVTYSLDQGMPELLQ